MSTYKLQTLYFDNLLLLGRTKFKRTRIDLMMNKMVIFVSYDIAVMTISWPHLPQILCFLAFCVALTVIGSGFWEAFYGEVSFWQPLVAGGMFTILCIGFSSLCTIWYKVPYSCPNCFGSNFVKCYRPQYICTNLSLCFVSFTCYCLN